MHCPTIGLLLCKPHRHCLAVVGNAGPSNQWLEGEPAAQVQNTSKAHAQSQQRCRPVTQAGPQHLDTLLLCERFCNHMQFCVCKLSACNPAASAAFLTSLSNTTEDRAGVYNSVQHCRSALLLHHYNGQAAHEQELQGFTLLLS